MVARWESGGPSMGPVGSVAFQIRGASLAYSVNNVKIAG